MNPNLPLRDSPVENNSSAPISPEPPLRKPLARKVLLAMAVRLLLVTVALTGFGYAHVMRAVTKQSLDDFERYIHLKSDRESELFRLAEDNQRALGKALVTALHGYGIRDPVEEFDKRYAMMENGTLTSRKEAYDGTKHASCTSDPDMAGKIDADLRRRAISANATIEGFGAAYHTRLLNTWFTTFDGLAFMFWPEKPDYHTIEQAQDDSTGDVDFLAPASPENNPARKIVWTKTYFDQVSKLLVVSVTAPVYDGDRYLGVSGHDLPLTQLLERTMSDHLEGNENILVRDDGFLIAHSGKIAQLAETRGGLDVMKSNDEALKGIFRVASRVEKPVAVVDSEDGKNYLGVTRISGPNWFLISVYPKALLQETAWSTARFILLGGIISLVVELALFYHLLRTRVTAPLGDLRRAIAKVTTGERTIELDTTRDDELGELAASFQTMAQAIDEREGAQKKAEDAILVLNQELTLNLEREKERNDRLVALQKEVDDLSTPILEVAKNVLALPIIGVIDSPRGQKIMERLLATVASKRARFVILDVTGTHDIDGPALEQLLKVIAAIRLLGARCVLTGVRPAIARAMISLGANLASVETVHSLGQALEMVTKSRQSKTKN